MQRCNLTQWKKQKQKTKEKDLKGWEGKINSQQTLGEEI